MNYEKNIESYKNVGLNADWAVSAYHITGNVYVVDNEDDSFSLVYSDLTDESHECIELVTFCGSVDYAFRACVEALQWNELEYLNR